VLPTIGRFRVLGRLTDAALTMFDKMMAGVFCKADRRHKDNLVNRAKILDSSARALLGMAKAMLIARASGTDPLAAVGKASEALR
jgi:hypothetical protein